MDTRVLLSILTVLFVCLGPVSPAGGDAPASKKWMAGTELDLIPYLSEGYYVSAVAGYDTWRARYVRTHLTLPGFATPSGFENNEMDVDAFIIDHYFRDGFKGWWIGPGFEIWRGGVKEKSSGLKKAYRAGILTLGGGYAFPLGSHFYFNPWAAIHIPVSGDTDVPFAHTTFRIRLSPEASVKLGLRL